jgi:hypothetical protein
MSDDWTDQMPAPEDYAVDGVVEWAAWRAAAVAAIDDIVRREGETEQD